jgi:hypothetical protein
MRLRIWPDDASALQMNDWGRMNDWLTELRAGGGADPPSGSRAGPAVGGCAGPAADGRAEPTRGGAQPEVAAELGAPAESATVTAGNAPAVPDAPEAAARALIGDQLRMPITWCEMGSCISWHSDPAALGEADMRARAISVGWRVDAFGRLACPRCQQTDPDFRASRPVVLWDRHTAIARAARIASVVSGRNTAQAPGC